MSEYFRVYGLNDVQRIVHIPVRRDEEEVHDDSELKRLCDIIYAPDERGLVNSDISIFLSKNANPQIKDWIQRNLMSPMSFDDAPRDMSDDEIAQYTRGRDESTEQYAQRLNDFYQSTLP